ncbi:hypothetical protein AOLI_G00158490 [Acnodon oligacanthus]
MSITLSHPVFSYPHRAHPACRSPSPNPRQNTKSRGHVSGRNRRGISLTPIPPLTATPESCFLNSSQIQLVRRIYRPETANLQISDSIVILKFLQNQTRERIKGRQRQKRTLAAWPGNRTQALLAVSATHHATVPPSEALVWMGQTWMKIKEGIFSCCCLYCLVSHLYRDPLLPASTHRDFKETSL